MLKSSNYHIGKQILKQMARLALKWLYCEGNFVDYMNGLYYTNVLSIFMFTASQSYLQDAKAHLFLTSLTM